MRDPKLYLKDILTAMDAIEQFVKGLDVESFKNNDIVSSAVIRKFEIIGEATKNISNSIRTHYSQIPWKQMAGMRDRLIHGYSEVDLNLVWETIQNRLPKLKSDIQSILKDEEEENS